MSINIKIQKHYWSVTTKQKTNEEFEDADPDPDDDICG